MVKKKQTIELIEEEKKESRSNGKLKKSILTLFLFLLPLLVIAYTNEFITKILLFFYLAVLLNNFIRDSVGSESEED